MKKDATPKGNTTKKDRTVNQNDVEKSLNQLEGIEKAQDHAKKSKLGKKQSKINSIKKSQQRLDNVLRDIKSLKDVQ